MLLQKRKSSSQGGSVRQVIETLPEMNLAPQDIDGLLDQVREYQATYKPVFQRREQREKSERYLQGLLSPEIKNKAIEPMMLELEGNNQNEIRAMQHFISEGAWDDDAVLARHRQEVAKDLGEEEGVFILDGSDFAGYWPFYGLNPSDMDFTPDGKYGFILSGGEGLNYGPILKLDMDTYEIVDAFYPPDGVSRLIRINPREIK